MKASSRSSPFLHPCLLDQTKDLHDRLSCTPPRDGGPGSWVTRKMARPTLDSLWSTLEGKFTSFVAGEGEEASATAPSASEAIANSKGKQIGPFSHYSAISPASTSGTVSRAQSISDLHGSAAYGATSPPASPPKRGGFPAQPPRAQPQRAPPSAQHQRTGSLGFSAFGSDPYATAPSWAPPTPVEEEDTTSTSADDTVTEATQPDSSGWWGAANGSTSTSANDSGNVTPAFQPIAESFAEDDSGFISPMGAMSRASSTPSNASPYLSSNARAQDNVEEEDDLGFGNSSSRRGSAKPEEQERRDARAASESSVSEPAKLAPADANSACPWPNLRANADDLQSCPGHSVFVLAE